MKLSYMNKRLCNKYRFLRVLSYVCILCTMIFAGCVYIDSISIKQVYNGKEVDYAYAGDVATFTMKGHIECQEDHSGVNFVVGFLAPKSWNIANNAKVTYKCDLADDRNEEFTMSVIPASTLPKNGGGRTWVECLTQSYGVGPNVLEDMEWVVFQTDRKWDIINNQNPNYTVSIRCNVGTQNLKCKLGFFANHTDDGFSSDEDHKKVVYSDCFEVVEGTGNVIDFCSHHYNKVTPLSLLQNDFVTFSFVGNAAENQLAKNEEIYFEGEAFTSTGKNYKVDKKDATTRMKKETAYGQTYNLTLWPVGFFSIPEGEQVDSILYRFTNLDGTVVIGRSDDEHDLGGKPAQDSHTPFVLEMLCQ